MAETIKIGGELESMATGKIVAAASAIKDKIKNKTQEQVNAETYVALENRYTKAETYNKTQLDSMITTPKTVYKDYDTYAEMEAETEHPNGAIYRVANYDGTQVVTNKYCEYSYNGTQYKLMAVRDYGIDDEPTAGSDNLVKSGGVQNELALGAVYDVSAKNPTAGPNNDGKWESLSALLSDVNLNTLIPTSVRKGGMSVKFVQSSDNKYVQYRLMTRSFSTTVSDWQGVDDEPKGDSKNLVESGGVASRLFLSLYSNTGITGVGGELIGVQGNTATSMFLLTGEMVSTDEEHLIMRLYLYDSDKTYIKYLTKDEINVQDISAATYGRLLFLDSSNPNGYNGLHVYGINNIDNNISILEDETLNAANSIEIIENNLMLELNNGTISAVDGTHVDRDDCKCTQLLYDTFTIEVKDGYYIRGYHGYTIDGVWQRQEYWGADTTLKTKTFNISNSTYPCYRVIVSDINNGDISNIPMSSIIKRVTYNIHEFVNKSIEYNNISYIRSIEQDVHSVLFSNTGIAGSTGELVPVDGNTATSLLRLYGNELIVEGAVFSRVYYYDKNGTFISPYKTTIVQSDVINATFARFLFMDSQNNSGDYSNLHIIGACLKGGLEQVAKENSNVAESIGIEKQMVIGTVSAVDGSEFVRNDCKHTNVLTTPLTFKVNDGYYIRGYHGYNEKGQWMQQEYWGTDKSLKEISFDEKSRFPKYVIVVSNTENGDITNIEGSEIIKSLSFGLQRRIEQLLTIGNEINDENPIMISDGMNYTSASAVEACYDDTYGIVFAAYMQHPSAYGEQGGHIGLSVFPATQPTNIRYVKVVDDEANRVYEPNIFLLSAGIVRVIYNKTDNAYYYKDYNYKTGVLSEEHELKMNINGTVSTLDITSCSAYLTSQGYTASVLLPIMTSTIFKYNNYWYAAISFDGTPATLNNAILCKSSDGETWEPFAVFPYETAYELDFCIDSNGKIHAVSRTKQDEYPIIYATSEDNGDNWSDYVAIDGSGKSRPRISNYRGKILIGANMLSNGRIENWHAFGAGRNHITMYLGNTEDVNDWRIVYDKFSKYGLLYFAWINIHDDLYLLFNDSRSYLNNSGNGGKEAIRYNKLGYI